jgi:Type IV secretion system pilin
MIRQLLSATLVFLSALLILSFSAVNAAFDPLNEACTNPNGNSQRVNDSPTCNQASTQGNTDPIAGQGGVINKAANLVALVAGIGAVVMIVLGGIFYITSGGDSQKAAAARSRIISGLIGLVVIALAWAIIGIVTGKIIR